MAMEHWKDRQEIMALKNKVAELEAEVAKWRGANTRNAAKVQELEDAESVLKAEVERRALDYAENVERYEAAIRRESKQRATAERERDKARAELNAALSCLEKLKKFQWVGREDYGELRREVNALLQGHTPPEQLALGLLREARGRHIQCSISGVVGDLRCSWCKSTDDLLGGEGA